MRSAIAIVIDLRLSQGMSLAHAQEFHSLLRIALRNQLHFHCQLKTWTSSELDNRNLLAPNMHVLVCPQLTGKGNHLLLSPPYTLQESYEALKWIPSCSFSRFSSATTNKSLSSTSVLQELVKLHESLKCSTNEGLSDVVFFSPLITQSGFFSKSILEMLEVLSEVNLSFVACSMGAPLQDTVSKIIQLRSRLSSYTNLQLSCVRNDIQDIEVVFQELNDNDMSRRGRVLTINCKIGPSSYQVTTTIRPFYTRLEQPTVVNVCRCHRRYPRNCPKLKSHPCMQNYRKVLQIGSGLYTFNSQLLNISSLSDNLSGSLIALVQKVEISPALTVGEPFLMWPSSGSERHELFWWHQLLQYLWQENKAAIIAIDGLLCEKHSMSDQHKITTAELDTAYVLVPLTGSKASQHVQIDYALLKRIVFQDELRSASSMLTSKPATSLDLGLIEQFETALDQIPIEEFTDDLLAGSIHESIAEIIRRGLVPVSLQRDTPSENTSRQVNSRMQVKKKFRVPFKKSN